MAAAYDTEMDGEQIDLIEDLDRAWEDYASHALDADEFVGGLSFKTVHGHEYLVRYRTDPDTRKKAFTSLGRRSPETERKLTAWTADRARNKEWVATTRARLERVGRMGKALGLARVPVKLADVIEAFNANPATRELRLAGPAALFVYEIKGRDLAARDRFSDLGDTVHFVGHRLTEDARYEIRKALGSFDPVDVGGRYGQRILWLASGIRVDVADASDLDLDDDLDAVRAVCLSKSAHPVLANALHPRAWLDMEDRLDGKWPNAREFVDRHLEKLAETQPEDEAAFIPNF